MSIVLGANLPWVRYGGDFGANAWWPDGGLASRSVDRARVLDVLLKLRAVGVTHLRWFFFCDARAGIRFGDDGAPIELQQEAWRDIDSAIGLVGTAGLLLMPVLFDFHLCRRRRVVSSVALGGHRRLIARDDFRERLMDTVVTPVLARYAQAQEIVAWDLFNEPEWATFGIGAWNPMSSVSRRAMRSYIRASAERVHAITRHQATVGTASAASLGLVRGLGLDFYQPHWYDRLQALAPIERHTSAFECDAPVVLGEFPTSVSRRTPAELIEAAERSGYQAAYFWSALSDDRFTHLDRATDAMAGRMHKVAPTENRGVSWQEFSATSTQTCWASRRSSA
jgi:hypothetical protein